MQKNSLQIKLSTKVTYNNKKTNINQVGKTFLSIYSFKKYYE